MPADTWACLVCSETHTIETDPGFGRVAHCSRVGPIVLHATEPIDLGASPDGTHAALAGLAELLVALLERALGAVVERVLAAVGRVLELGEVFDPEARRRG